MIFLIKIWNMDSKEYMELLFENGDVYKGEVESDKFNGLGLFYK